MTLETWRVRPGAEIPVTLRGRAALDVYLVRFDQEKAVDGEHWGPADLREVESGLYEGVFVASASILDSYQVRAVARDGDSVFVSNPVQVICGAFHVGA